MLFFRGRNVLRRVMLFAAPLLIVGMLLWQRQPGLASISHLPSGDSSRFALTDPPAGILSDEWHAAAIDFEAIVDSSFQSPPTEMPAYWRLLKWTAQEPNQNGDQANFGHVTFNDLVQQPRRWRGRPVQLDLHVCRIAECAAPANRLGIERLYEVWGWSEDSRGSLYVAVTLDLPAGMSVGESVNERATVRGYFYKLQGYVAAGPAAQSLPTAAPLVVGRLSRWQAPAAAIATSNELWLGGAGLVLAASFLFLLGQSSRLRRPHSQQVRPKAAAKLESWVDSFEQDLAATGPITAEGAA